MKNKYSLLFVDDEEMIIKYFVKIFDNEFNIYTATNITQALQILKDHHQEIAIIISDQKMKGGTGVDLFNDAKQKYPDIVRVMTTAYASLEDSIRAIKEGNVYSYITKPWDIEDIKKTVREALIEFNAKKRLVSLAGSIAHELRNPFLAIKFLSESLELEDSNGQLANYKRQISKIIKLAADVIDITLFDLSGKKLDKSEFVNINAFEAVAGALAIYGYQNQLEQDKIFVKFDEVNSISARQITENVRSQIKSDQNFIFKGIDTPFKYIIFNLIKNALYYINDEEYKDSHIEIAFQKNLTVSDDIISKFSLREDLKQYNAITVTDNGPGIPDKNILKIFDSFFTLGKKEGTGLGLNFCLRAMNDFGGGIICESEVNEYTKFTLLFPIIDGDIKEDSLQNLDYDIELNSKKNILIIDDSDYAQRLADYIKRQSPNIFINLVENEEKALGILSSSNSNYLDLILINIESKKINNLRVLDYIRDKLEFSKEKQPILAYGNELINYDRRYNQFCLIDNLEFLTRSVSKWILNNHVPKNDCNQETDESNILKGCNIIIADDQMVNLMVIAKKFQKAGANIFKCNDGKDIINLIEEKPTKYNLIITDVNMNEIDGIEAAKRIREIQEKYNNVNNKSLRIPIIALTGDGEKDFIVNLLNNQIDDYLIKGCDGKYMIKLSKFWINYCNQPN